MDLNNIKTAAKNLSIGRARNGVPSTRVVGDPSQAFFIKCWLCGVYEYMLPEQFADILYGIKSNLELGVDRMCKISSSLWYSGNTQRSTLLKSFAEGSEDREGVSTLWNKYLSQISKNPVCISGYVSTEKEARDMLESKEAPTNILKTTISKVVVKIACLDAKQKFGTFIQFIDQA